MYSTADYSFFRPEERRREEGEERMREEEGEERRRDSERRRSFFRFSGGSPSPGKVNYQDFF